jgi:hypothetical protein
MNHAFFSCPFARYTWNIVSCVTGFKCEFDNVENCFNVWLTGFGKKEKEYDFGVSC